MAFEQPKIYKEPNGDKQIVASGGEIAFQSGSTFTMGGAQTITGSVTDRVQTKAANYSVVAGDSGSTFVATAADVVFSLPATVAGLRYTFITGAVSTGTGMSVSPVAADKFMGSLMGATGPVAITAADDKDVINSGATDVLGDSVTIIGDGTDGWYVVGVTGVWARQA